MSLEAEMKRRFRASFASYGWGRYGWSTLLGAHARADWVFRECWAIDAARRCFWPPRFRLPSALQH